MLKWWLCIELCDRQIDRLTDPSCCSYITKATGWLQLTNHTVINLSFAGKIEIFFNMAD